MERLLKEKAPDIKLLLLKNFHVFLEQLDEQHREQFARVVIETLEGASRNDWRLKEVLAKNLSHYARLFDLQTVYSEFLPMFFKFCADTVHRVGLAACPALADLLLRFADDEHKQNGIARVVRKRYYQSRTYKKRQLFVVMCQGKLMQQKELFERHFKQDFLSLANDKVPNVRIALAAALKHHFIKEIEGAFVEDREINDMVRLLKQDSCEDVSSLLRDVQTLDQTEGDSISIEVFMARVHETKAGSS
jgi:serine/threonine-protein phosphatase 4 regulatory subunit 1